MSVYRKEIRELRSLHAQNSGLQITIKEGYVKIINVDAAAKLSCLENCARNS